MIVLPKSFYDVILDTAKKGRPEEIWNEKLSRNTDRKAIQNHDI